jgi:ACR3 family arsenite efflux pump ArsB
MSEWFDGALGLIGVTLKTLIASAIGAFVSLRFFDGLKPVEKWTTFLGGWGMAAYAAAPLTTYFELSKVTETGIALAVGLFGMSISAALIKVIKETNWGALVSSFLSKKGGGQ